MIFNWNLPKEKELLVSKICKRAFVLELTKDYQGSMMDLTCVINHCVDLDLERFLKSDDVNFSHDFCGIAYNLNRTTGVLENCFLPRFSKI